MSLELTGIKSYKKLSRLLRNESFEPLISWGIRMALSGTLPVVWGLATGRVIEAAWITLTAEAVSWVELKGSFTWRVRTMLSAAILAVLFAVFGMLTCNSIWLSITGMFIAGFIATLLKNIGDRASGLAICVYLLFIICNAFPVKDAVEFEHRMWLVGLGAAWPVFVGVCISVVAPAEEPFRRQIALIWRSIAELVTIISRKGTTGSKKEHADEVYEKEKNIRTAIDNSYQFYGRMAHQVKKEDNKQFQLAMLRKVAGLVAVNVLAIEGEIEHIDIPGLDNSLRLKAAALLSALEEAVSRISVFVITLKPEEKLIAISHISRMRKLAAFIKEYPLPDDAQQVRAINRTLLITERTAKLLENAILRVDLMGKDKPVFKSYSFAKTLFILKPKYFLSNLRVLFNLNTFNTRYALRSAIAATIGLLIYKWFNIDHGYWMAFSVMIVIQPYFGATFKKAIDRVIGTLLGGIAGGLLLKLPAGLYLNEVILFLTFILMVYYVKKNYAVAAFIITLNLVLLFHLEEAYNNKLMVIRAACTAGGALLAVVSGFALFPTWDRKWLPSHLADAIKANYTYFLKTFFSPERITNWTRMKRDVESKNSNVFDSFNRYMSEPGKEKSTAYYDLMTHNVRIARNLNNTHLEQDEKRGVLLQAATPHQQARINDALGLFNEVILSLPALDKNSKMEITDDTARHPTPFVLNEAQLVSLEKLIIELRSMKQEMSEFKG